MNIIIRCDASVNIGTGHVMRCLTLADELKSRGNNIEFICAELPGNLIEYTRKKGYNVHSLDDNSVFDSQVLEVLSKKVEFQKWIIIDHYGYNYKSENPLREFSDNIMVIDDLADRKHDCDILLDQNYSRISDRYNHLVSENCTKLLGTEYALLRKEFSDIRQSVSPRNGHIHRILIFFGGADQDNVTLKSLQAFQSLDMSNIEVDVVIGLSNPNRDSIEKAVEKIPGATLSIQVSDMAKRMAAADLFIGAGGATTWERMCLGLPSIVVVIAENQQQIAEDLASDDLIINLGWHEKLSPEEILKEVLSLISDSNRLRIMSRNSMALVDGLGTKRVADEILGFSV